MRSTLRLGRLFGIEIGIHYTWLLAFVLITWSLAQGFFPQSYPGWTAVTYWVTGILAALLLFASVLLHELAHSLVGRARGMTIRSITLFIFGGVSNMEGEADRPSVEFIMSMVGPLTSLLIGGILWGVAISATGTSISFMELFNGNKFSTPFEGLIGYLAFINMVLAFFNLLPGFPLDGGRVLRSILWGTTGNLVKATNIAAALGRFFGWALIAFGVFQMLTGNLLGGLWIAFIGWFLSSAADASRREITLHEQLSGTRVKELMDLKIEAISPEVSVQDLVWGIFRQHHRRAVLVLQNNQLVGIVTVTDVKELSQDKWPRTPVAEIMTRQPLYSVTPEDELNSALKLIASHDLNQVPVLNQGKLVGILSRSDIIRYPRVKVYKTTGTKRSLRMFLQPEEGMTEGSQHVIYRVSPQIPPVVYGYLGFTLLDELTVQVANFVLHALPPLIYFAIPTSIKLFPSLCPL